MNVSCPANPHVHHAPGAVARLRDAASAAPGGSAMAPLAEIRRIVSRVPAIAVFEHRAEISAVLQRSHQDGSTYEALASALHAPIRPDPVWQKLLIALRAGMLHLHESAPHAFLALRRLALALALDAGRAGYDDPLPWPIAGRTTSLAQLCQSSGQPSVERDLAMLAYGMLLPPPTDFARIVEADGVTLAEATILMAETVGIRMHIQRACGRVEALGSIEHEVSRRVGDHHDAYPFPIWRDPAEAATETPLHDSFRGRINDELFRGAFRVLVAGCGTGRDPIALARASASAQVLGFDLSPSSLAYAMHKAGELGVGNVAFARADVLALPARLGQFAQVEAVGVIHHTADPQKALKILGGHLLPGGVLKLAVHSARARAPLRAVKAAIDRLPAAAMSTRGALLGAVIDAPQHSPFAALKFNRDFYAVASRRDLLFHPCETSFTPSNVADLGRRAGLRLLGFGFWSGDHKRAYHQSFPSDPFAADADRVSRFEHLHPSAFARMIVAYFTKDA